MKPPHLVFIGCIAFAVFTGCVAKPSLTLNAQQQALIGKKLHWQMFTMPPQLEGMDHIHCVFCQAQLVEAGGESRRKGETDGYTTDDGLVWVCNRCFDRLNPQFRWIEI